MLLTARDIHKTFTSAEGPFAVLRGVDLCLDAGETLALTGESGSGKSTLLHLVGGLDVPDRGSILLEGADVAAMDDTARAALRRGTVGLVFQQFNLIPSLTVAAKDNSSAWRLPAHLRRAQSLCWLMSRLATWTRRPPLT